MQSTSSESTISKLNQLKIKIPQNDTNIEENKFEQYLEFNWDVIFSIMIPEIVIEKQTKEKFVEMDWDSIQENWMEVYKHQDCDYEYDCVDGIYE